MNKPLTQKEKLIKKVNDLDRKLIELDDNIQNPKEDLYPSSLMNEFFSILDSLPNRVLAKIIRDAKVKVKELKIEEKEHKGTTSNIDTLREEE